MSIIFHEKIICGVCGEESDYTSKSASFGALDLDAGFERCDKSYVQKGIPRCPKCGYAAFKDDFSNCSKDVKKLVVSIEYQAIINNKETPKNASSFLALAYEKQYMHQYSDSAWSLIYAAWVCDSENDYPASKKCREKAIHMIGKANSHGQKIADKDGESAVITIDLMRRAGLFEQALKLVEETKEKFIHPNTSTKVIYEENLIKLQDTGAHQPPGQNYDFYRSESGIELIRLRNKLRAQPQERKKQRELRMRPNNPRKLEKRHKLYKLQGKLELKKYSSMSMYLWTWCTDSIVNGRKRKALPLQSYFDEASLHPYFKRRKTEY